MSCRKWEAEKNNKEKNSVSEEKGRIIITEWQQNNKDNMQKYHKSPKENEDKQTRNDKRKRNVNKEHKWEIKNRKRRISTTIKRHKEQEQNIEITKQTNKQTTYRKTTKNRRKKTRIRVRRKRRKKGHREPTTVKMRPPYVMGI